MDVTVEEIGGETYITVVSKGTEADKHVITYRQFRKHVHLSKEDQDELSDELENFAEFKQKESEGKVERTEEQIKKEKEIQKR